MADDGRKNESRTEPLNLRIPPTLKKDFKKWCIDHDTEMSAEIIAFIQKRIAAKPRKP